MNQVKRPWERLSEEEKKMAIENLISFFETERDERIGIIAAERLVNFFLQTMGSSVYNKAILDAKNALRNRIEELNFDLDDLIDI